MQQVDLYRYEVNGKVTITPKARHTEDIPSRMRLIADEGYILTNGEINTPVIDITLEDIKLWSEIPEPSEEFI